MNNSTVATVLSRNELLAFMLLAFPFSIIALVVNSIIIYLYVRYKALRAEGLPVSIDEGITIHEIQA